MDGTVIQLLKHAQYHYQNPNENPIQSRSPIFNNEKLIDIAGEFRYEIFFIQPILRRAVAHEWEKVESL